MGEFVLPQPLLTDRGEVRRVGVELEFAGMSLEAAAEAVCSAFDGAMRQDHEHRYFVTTDLGEFEITYDTALLREQKAARTVQRFGLGQWVKTASEWVLRKLSDAALPLEVSTPPIPATRLSDLNVLEQALRERRGRRNPPRYLLCLRPPLQLRSRRPIERSLCEPTLAPFYSSTTGCFARKRLTGGGGCCHSSIPSPKNIRGS